MMLPPSCDSKVSWLTVGCRAHDGGVVVCRKVQQEGLELL